MSKPSLLADVAHFVGWPTNDCIDQIKEVARLNRYSVLIQDASFNPNNIASDESRLNVRQDGNGVIISFSIG